MLDKPGYIVYYNVAFSKRETPYPGVAQLVACLVRDQEAVGSNPATRTKRLEIIRISSLLRFLSRFCRPLGFFTEMEVTKRPL